MRIDRLEDVNLPSSFERHTQYRFAAGTQWVALPMDRCYSNRFTIPLLVGAGGYCVVLS